MTAPAPKPIADCPNPECKHFCAMYEAPFVSNDGLMHKVKCDDCGYMGPWARTSDEAIRLHNLLCRPQQSAAPVAQEWYPERCPITQRPFFMTIEHPEHGMVPTYGGPYDSYTIPERDDDGDWICERYDHDDGAWVEGYESTGIVVVKDSAPAASPGPSELVERPNPETQAVAEIMQRDGRFSFHSLVPIEQFHDGMKLYRSPVESAPALAPFEKPKKESETFEPSNEGSFLDLGGYF